MLKCDKIATQHGEVLELADRTDLGSVGATREGSNPSFPTRQMASWCVVGANATATQFLIHWLMYEPRKDTVLKIDVQTQDDWTALMTVEVPEERVQPALKAAARKLSQQTRIPGFRPGKAPYDVVLRMFGKPALYEAAMDDLGQKVYEEALQQSNLEAAATAHLENIQLEPMALTFHVPLKPEVILPDHRAVRVPYSPPSITEEAVNDVLNSLRDRQATTEAVQRPAELGDVATLDVNGFFNEGLNPSDFLMADKDVQFNLDASADWPMPGFANQLVGLSAGDTRTFDMAFPEDYANESLRGQLAHFEVTVKDVKGRTLPELSDEFAKSVGDFNSLDELTSRIRSDLQKQAERANEQDYLTQAMEQLLAQASIKHPPVLLNDEVTDMVRDLDQRLREQRLTLEDYLKIEGKSEDDLREEFKPRAQERLKRSLILGKIVDLENLRVSDDELLAEVDKMTTMMPTQAEAVRKYYSQNAEARLSLAMNLLTQKAQQRLIAIAKGEDLPPLAAETPAEAPAA